MYLFIKIVILLMIITSVLNNRTENDELQSFNFCLIFPPRRALKWEFLKIQLVLIRITNYVQEC